MMRWARRELEAAKQLGVRRQLRLRYESRADLEPVELPCGIVLQPEVKHRKRLPRLLVAALEQARRYESRAVPIAVISERGGSALVVLPLAAFCEIAGLRTEQIGPARG